jgi:hypothetical protein
MTSYDVTRRELLELTVAGGALAAGQLLPAAATSAAAQDANTALAPLTVVLRVASANVAPARC